MAGRIVEREKDIELAKTMPLEKLVSWYEYGLFIQTRADVDDDLAREFAQWERASDEDFLELEKVSSVNFGNSVFSRHSM